MEAISTGEQAALDLLTKGWDGFLAGRGRGLLEAALPAWLSRQRWFGAKSRTIVELRIAEWVEIPLTAASAIVPLGSMPSASTLGDVLLVVGLTYADGARDRYQVPLAYASGGMTGSLRVQFPGSIVLAVDTPTGEAMFHDATVREEFRQALLGMIEHELALPVGNGFSASEHVAATLIAAHESRAVHDVAPGETREIAAAIARQHSIEVEDVAPAFAGHMPGAIGGEGAAPALPPQTGTELNGRKSEAFASARGTGLLAARLSVAEQSNTNIIYGQRMIMKVFRRLQAGLNPDVEIGRFLTEVAHFPRIAPFVGEITVGAANPTTIAMLQGLVANDGDGWEWTLGELASFYAAALDDSTPTGQKVKSLAADYLKAAGLLGKRTAEMHLALASDTDNQAFHAETLTSTDLKRDARRVEVQISEAMDALQQRLSGLPQGPAGQAAEVLMLRKDLLERARTIADAAPSGERIRIHGDYHLGQILRSEGDFVLLDFEGEPAKTLEERRRKQSPLKDVAGMLRSFSYAAYSGLETYALESRKILEAWAMIWVRTVGLEFLRSYESTARTRAALLPDVSQMRDLLDVYLLEKALYELAYELNHRPAWVGIPLAGILALRK